jgi:hypothetical protein
MKLTRRILFYCLVAIPIVLHFYLLTNTLINFPNWGDDFLFFELIDHFQRDSWTDFVQFLFKPHNSIHLLVLGKIFVLFCYFLFGSLQLKSIIIFANAFLLGILFLFYRHVKVEKYPTWHILPITILLFAPSVSIDNYNLIGLIQHSASLLFLTLIAYLTVKRTHSILLILLLVSYPLVSTEGWAMLPLMAVFMFVTKHPLKKTVLVLSVLGIGGFGYLMGHYPQTANSTPMLLTLTQAPLAFLTFLGNAAWRISDTYRIPVNAGLGLVLLLISLWGLRKKIMNGEPWGFPTIIWQQILATGAMICIGRSQGSSIATLVLSERFYTYASFATMATYLLIIPRLKSSAFNQALILSGSLIYFVGSFYYYHANQSQLRNRLVADLTNAYNLAASTSYHVESGQLTYFMHVPFYQAPPADMLQPRIPRVQKLKLISINLEKQANGTLSFQIDQIPGKISLNENRWLAIQSQSSPDSTFIVPFFLDKENKPKIVHINSLQLQAINQKNLWLYTQMENGQARVSYLGSTP